MEVYNPVESFYSSYKFNDKLPIIQCSNYEDVLNKAKTSKTSCILYNKDKNIVKDKNIQIDLSYDTNIEIVLILNLELTGKSTLKITGKNYSLSNVYFKDGDKSFKVPNFLVEIGAENLKSSQEASRNISIGYATAKGLTGDDNVIIGNEAVTDTTSTGSKNVIVGANGVSNLKGSGNVFLGYKSANDS